MRWQRQFGQGEKLKTLADLVSFWNKNLIEILCIYIQL
jgi:hypothetical protein